MSLQADIDQYKAGFIEKVPADIREKMMAATQDLSDSGLVSKAPQKGDKLAIF